MERYKLFSEESSNTTDKVGGAALSAGLAMGVEL